VHNPVDDANESSGRNAAAPEVISLQLHQWIVHHRIGTFDIGNRMIGNCYLCYHLNGTFYLGHIIPFFTKWC